MFDRMPRITHTAPDGPLVGLPVGRSTLTGRLAGVDVHLADNTITTNPEAIGAQGPSPRQRYRGFGMWVRDPWPTGETRWRLIGVPDSYRNRLIDAPLRPTAPPHRGLVPAAEPTLLVAYPGGYGHDRWYDQKSWSQRDWLHVPYDPDGTVEEVATSVRVAAGELYGTDDVGAKWSWAIAGPAGLGLFYGVSCGLELRDHPAHDADRESPRAVPAAPGTDVRCADVLTPDTVCGLVTHLSHHLLVAVAVLPDA